MNYYQRVWDIALCMANDHHKGQPYKLSEFHTTWVPAAKIAVAKTADMVRAVCTIAPGKVEQYLYELGLLEFDPSKSVNVRFLHDIQDGEVFAVFPDVYDNTVTHHEIMLTCYAHVGQHSSCSPNYVKECKEASAKDYKPLENELIALGYQLTILNSL